VWIWLVRRAIEKWGSLENIQLQKDLRKAREKQEHAGLSCVFVCVGLRFMFSICLGLSVSQNLFVRLPLLQ